MTIDPETLERCWRALRDAPLGQSWTDEHETIGSLVESLVYDDPPETLGDPADEAARLQAGEIVHRALAGLADYDRGVLEALYGLRGEPLTVTALAARLGVSRRTVCDHARLARDRLARRVLGLNA